MHQLVEGHSVWLDPETFELQPEWEVDRPILRHVHDLAMEIENPVLVDVGAAVGIFTLLAATVPDMICHAFEPQPDMLNVLRRNILGNGLGDRVLVYPLALAETSGVRELWCPLRKAKMGLSTLGSKAFKGGYPLQVPVITLDQALYGRVDLLKIDVEGCELFVLQGGVQTIRTYKPYIMAEMQDKRTRQFGYQASEIANLLSGWGYQSRPLDKRNTFFWYD